MDSVLKGIRVISTLVFLAVLLYVYAYLPEQISIPYRSEEANSFFISKNNLFYLSIGIFLFLALFIFLMKKLGEGLSYEMSHFKNLITLWADSFMVVVNIFIIISLIIISVINNKEGVIEGNYQLLSYVGPGLLFLWLIFLIVVFIKRSGINKA